MSIQQRQGLFTRGRGRRVSVSAAVVVVAIGLGVVAQNSDPAGAAASWAVATPSVLQHVPLTGVSCPTATFCAASAQAPVGG